MRGCHASGLVRTAVLPGPVQCFGSLQSTGIVHGAQGWGLVSSCSAFVLPQGEPADMRGQPGFTEGLF